MNLYEINEQIIEAFDLAIDPETGEIIDEEAFDRLDRLKEDFEEKVENLAIYVKDLKAQAVALKTEKERYLSNVLNGQKRTYTRAAISYRKSEAVMIVNEAEFLRFYQGREFVKEKIERTLDKNCIKGLLKQGEILVGAWLDERTNIQIK